MKKIVILVLGLIVCQYSFGQSLFESAASIESKTDLSDVNYDLNGYVRGVAYVGENPVDGKTALKSGYGEAALKLKASKSDFGSFFTELRFRDGYEYGDELEEFEVTEAYVTAYAGPLDIRLGKQIVAWGKADGVNPTDNITPINGVVRSPESDDLRIGNFLTKINWNLSSIFQLEGIYIPKYRNSVMTFDLLEWPEGSQVGEDFYPNQNLKNASYALKLKYAGAKVDGSISYFAGYNTLPGLIVSSFQMNPDYSTEVEISPKAFRNQIIGADFSTSLGNWGVRGEGAYRIVPDRYDDDYYAPESELFFVLGFDRSWGDFSLIAQYMGRYVPDFEKVSNASPEEVGAEKYTELQLARVNQLYFQQNDVWNHSMSLRPAMNFLYDNLTIEAFGMYHFTTEEFLLRPQVTYSMSDGIKLSAGAEYYHGGEDTLNDLISPIFNGAFVELRMSF